MQSIIIPKGITSIGRFAFDNCSNLQSVYITDITAWCGISFYDEVGSNPLYGANLYLNGNLVTNLIIPNNIAKIADFAFCGCVSLQNITISNSLIGEKSFSSCKNLQQVTIGNGVTSIGYGAFMYCSALNKVFCKSTIPPTANFSGNSSWNGFSSESLLIYVPTTAVNTYKTRNGWKDYAKYIVADE